MADIKISELTQAESLSTSDLLESAVPYNGGFLSRRMSLAQLSNYLENYVQHQALTTTAKTIVSAINEVLGDLANYYTISQTYSKTEVDTLIAGVSGLHFLVVSQLPTTDIDVNTIYLVPKQDVGTQDIYDEFIYIVEEAPTPSHWEKIGTTEIDLSDYVTDTELTNILNDYVTSSGLSTILANYATTSAMTTALADKVDKVSGKGLSTEDYTTAEKTKVNGLATVATSGSYNDLTDKPTIPTVNNKKISITQNGTAVDSFTLNQNSNKTIEVKDEKVKQTEMTDDRVLKSLAIASDNTTTTDTDGVEKCNGLAVRLRKQPRPGLASTVDLCIGNDIPVGTDNNYVGILRMFGTHEYSTNIHAGNSTDDREIVFPDADGTLALQSELPTNPVLWSENNWLGAKNLNSYPYYETNHTEAGITWTDNGDGTVTANNTSTGNSSFICHSRIAGRINPLLLPNGKYILSGCPSGGSDSKYRLVAYVTKNGSASALGTDYGEGVVIEVNGDDNFNDKAYVQICADIRGVGFQANNLIFRPMLRLASIVDNTFEPYAQTNRQLTINKMDWNDYTEYGVKNLIKYPWYHSSGRVNRGITFTYDEEGYITLNGTADASNNPYFSYSLRSNVNAVTIKSGKKYTLAIDKADSRPYSAIYFGDISGTPLQVATRTVYDDGTIREETSDFVSLNYNGVSYKYATFEVIESGDYRLQIDLRVSANSGLYTNVKARVILQDAKITDLSWMPYAMSNYELTLNKMDVVNIAPIENGDTASQAYTIGDYMIWKRRFYKVTAAISSGGAISSKVTATTLSAEIKAIRDALNI